MGSKRTFSSFSKTGKENSPEEFLPDGKEDRTLIFKEEYDEDGFPKVFSLKVQEVKMFLRVVHYYTCRLLWEMCPEDIGPLELLLGFQFLEWYENLPVTSNLLTKELQMTFVIWNSLFDSKKASDRWNFHPLQMEFREKINENLSQYGHLSYMHYHAECSRESFLNYIHNHLISQREIQRRNQNHQSHFKRSSDHSNSTRGNTSSRIPPPRVREFELWELNELLELSPQERKQYLE